MNYPRRNDTSSQFFSVVAGQKREARLALDVPATTERGRTRRQVFGIIVSRTRPKHALPKVGRWCYDISSLPLPTGLSQSRR